MNRSMFLLALLIGAVLFSGSAYAAEVNVSSRWCGGGCSEGHDDKECICTYDGRYSQSSSWAWVSCEEVRCCDVNYVYCDLGYVFEGVNGFCDYEFNDTETCAAQKPDGGWITCEVQCGSSTCWAAYGAQNWETVNEGSSNYCTRSNETADWWNPWTWTTPCTLQQQSPWDDHGSGLICG